jgi:hypothetical protein
MGVFHVEQNEFLVFEDGPSQTFDLQWATYQDASDQCSLSRIWGGIHPPVDDIPGRIIGKEVGLDAFHYAESFFYTDADEDGFLSYVDCDDDNPAINPDAIEICDGIDNDCNGIVDDNLTLYAYYLDADNDGFGDAGISLDTCSLLAPAGFVTNNLDCDDNNPDINPDAPEVCDSLDNNCSGFINDGLESFTYYRDADQDGFGDGGISVDTCATLAPAGFVANNLDCNDNNPDINPDAPEICDSLDNNCSGFINDGLDVFTYYRDADQDGFGDEGIFMDTCLTASPEGFVAIGGDCNDNDANINPDAAEVCDDIDNNCNGILNDGWTYLPTTGMPTRTALAMMVFSWTPASPLHRRALWPLAAIVMIMMQTLIPMRQKFAMISTTTVTACSMMGWISSPIISIVTMTVMAMRIWL